MTIKKVVQGLIVTAALCLSTTSVHAQGYRLFIMGADSSLADQKSFYERAIPWSSAYAGGGKVTVGVEAPFYKIFGLELSYGMGPNNLEMNNTNYMPAYSLIKGYGVRNDRASADIVVHVPGVWRGVRAYGVLGVEYDVFSPTSSAKTLAKTEGFACSTPTKTYCGATLSATDEGGYNIGGGLDYKVARKIDLRLEARDHLFGSPTYGLPTSFTSASSAYYPISGGAHDIEYSIGIVYRFGKK